MAWVTFGVKQQNASNQSDGQANFTFVLSSQNGGTNNTLNSGASFQYRITANAPAQAVFTTTKAYTAGANGSFTLDDVTGINPAIHIPAAGSTFQGGNYDSLTGIVFTPSGSSAGTISGTFVDTTVDGTADPCPWDASVTTPEPEGTPLGKAQHY
jgi:hypothetical protein